MLTNVLGTPIAVSDAKKQLLLQRGYLTTVDWAWAERFALVTLAGKVV